jgi:phosphate:Na+ symporter
LRRKGAPRSRSARATEAHFARIRAGRIGNRETGAIHLDVLRDLKRINAHRTTAADPVLDWLGELLPSWLWLDGAARSSPESSPIQ